MRRTHVKPKKANNRRATSTQWLNRQLNDPYTQRARAEGYRARSVYKLSEIQDKYRILKPSHNVVDLGAAPGSWCQYASEIGCNVVAVDLASFEPISGVLALRGDFLNAETQEALRQALKGEVDVILSDMAASSTGQKAVDRLKAEALGDAVLEFADRRLRTGGHLVSKLLRGSEASILETAKSLFHTARLLKPKATHRESSEIYLIGLNRRGEPGTHIERQSSTSAAPDIDN